MRYDDPTVDEPETSWAWFRNAMLIVNPSSELMSRHVPPLFRNAEARKHIPLAIFDLAALFSLGSFPLDYQFFRWNAVKEWAFQFEKVASLEDAMIRNEHDVDRLRHELECAVRERYEAQEEVSYLRAMLGVCRRDSRSDAGIASSGL